MKEYTERTNVSEDEILDRLAEAEVEDELLDFQCPVFKNKWPSIDAGELLDKPLGDNLPVDIRWIIENKFGIEVRLSKRSKKLPSAIVASRDGKIYIELSRYLTKKEKSFCLAYELGHLQEKHRSEMCGTFCRELLGLRSPFFLSVKQWAPWSWVYDDDLNLRMPEYAERKEREALSVGPVARYSIYLSRSMAIEEHRANHLGLAFLMPKTCLDYDQELEVPALSEKYKVRYKDVVLRLGHRSWLKVGIIFEDAKIVEYEVHRSIPRKVRIGLLEMVCQQGRLKKLEPPFVGLKRILSGSDSARTNEEIAGFSFKGSFYSVSSTKPNRKKKSVALLEAYPEEVGRETQKEWGFDPDCNTVEDVPSSHKKRTCNPVVPFWRQLRASDLSVSWSFCLLAAARADIAAEIKNDPKYSFLCQKLEYKEI